MDRLPERNRKIWLEFEAGESVPSLAKTYELSIFQIKQILTAERLRLEVSTDRYYRTVRIPKR